MAFTMNIMWCFDRLSSVQIDILNFAVDSVDIVI